LSYTLITGSNSRFLFLYELQNISSGMKLWGVIAEVNEKDLAVSLPGGLRGLVRGSEAIELALLDSTKVVVCSSFLASLENCFMEADDV